MSKIENILSAFNSIKVESAAAKSHFNPNEKHDGIAYLHYASKKMLPEKFHAVMAAHHAKQETRHEGIAKKHLEASNKLTNKSQHGEFVKHRHLSIYHHEMADYHNGLKKAHTQASKDLKYAGESARKAYATPRKKKPVEK